MSVRQGELLDDVFVASLPPRVAHAVHAMFAAGSAYAHGSTLLTAAEVCEYDAGWEALTPQHTAAALREAQKRQLVAYVGRGLWTPTNRAHNLKRALEDRFLRDEDAA